MTKSTNIKVRARTVLGGVLAGAGLVAVMTVIPPNGASAAPRVPVPECGGLNIQAPDFQFDLRGCDDRRYVDYDHRADRGPDYGPWPGDWNAAPVQNWRWAKDGPEGWWGCVGFVPTDRRFSPGDIIFNDPTCGRGSAFAAYRPGQTGVFWR